MRFFYLLQKLAHPVVFGAIALLVLGLLRPSWRHGTPLLYLAAFLAAVAFGAATEIAQFLTHRDPALQDVLRDALGAATGLAALAAAAESALATAAARPWRVGALALALAGAAIMGAPVAHGLVAYGHRDLAFPVLASFDSPLDEYFVSPIGTRGSMEPGLKRIVIPARWARSPAERALYVPLARGPWAGISLDEPYPDWRGRSLLCVELTNPAPAELEIGVRVHDRAHVYRYDDRFNGWWQLAGESRATLRIPVSDIEAAPRGRRMDLEHIAGVMVFLPGSPANPPALLLNRIWLE